MAAGRAVEMGIPGSFDDRARPITDRRQVASLGGTAVAHAEGSPLAARERGRTARIWSPVWGVHDVADAGFGLRGERVIWCVSVSIREGVVGRS